MLFVFLVRKELKSILEVSWNIQSKSFPEEAVLTESGLCAFCCSPVPLNYGKSNKPTGCGGSSILKKSQGWLWAGAQSQVLRAVLPCHSRLSRSGPWGADPTCVIWLSVLAGTQICCPTQCSGTGLGKMFHCCNFSRANMERNENQTSGAARALSPTRGLHTSRQYTLFEAG